MCHRRGILLVGRPSTAIAVAGAGHCHGHCHGPRDKQTGDPAHAALIREAKIFHGGGRVRELRGARLCMRKYK